jgi:hypothetical protein
MRSTYEIILGTTYIPIIHSHRMHMNNTTKTLAILSAVLAIGTALAGFASQNAFAQSSTTAGATTGNQALCSAGSASQNVSSAGSAAGGFAADCDTADGNVDITGFQTVP